MTRTLAHDVSALPKKVGLPFTISAIFSPTPSFQRRTVAEWLVWDRTDESGNLVFQAPFGARHIAKWPGNRWVWDKHPTVVTMRLREVRGSAAGPWIDVRPPN